MRMDKDICKVMFNEVELQGVCKRLGEQITKGGAATPECRRRPRPLPTGAASLFWLCGCGRRGGGYAEPNYLLSYHNPPHFLRGKC